MIITHIEQWLSIVTYFNAILTQQNQPHLGQFDQLEAAGTVDVSYGKNFGVGAYLLKAL